MPTFVSESPEQTESLGAAWAAEVEPGWVVLLRGDLGSGKTCLVRGMARGLGSPARVHSPTFSLLHVYEGGRLPLYHLDLYRLDGVNAVVAAGLDQYLVGDGVTMIEWPERLGATVGWPDWAVQPRHLRRVVLEIAGPRLRRIVYEDAGD